MSVESSLKLVYSTMYGKNYRIVVHTLREKCPNMEFFLFRIQSECEKINFVSGHFSRSHIPKNCIGSRHFYSFSFPTQNSPASYHHILRRGTLIIPAGSIFFKNLFPSTAVSSGENYDLL